MVDDYLGEQRYDSYNSLYFNAGLSTPQLILKRVGFDITAGLVMNKDRNGNIYFYAAPLTSQRISFAMKK